MGLIRLRKCSFSRRKRIIPTRRYATDGGYGPALEPFDLATSYMPGTDLLRRLIHQGRIFRLGGERKGTIRMPLKAVQGDEKSHLKAISILTLL